jgi:hypothetical protein
MAQPSCKCLNGYWQTSGNFGRGSHRINMLSSVRDYELLFANNTLLLEDGQYSTSDRLPAGIIPYAIFLL